MEKKLTEAFDAVHMDDACAAKIEAAMKTQKTRSTTVRPVLRAAAAACLVLVMVLACNPTMVQAMEIPITEAIEKIRATFQRIPGTVVVKEDYAYFNDGIIELEHAETGTSVSFDTSKPPLYLQERDGRLYFTGNLENIDITDLISIEEPFTYTYDKNGITYYIAVGGKYDPDTGIASIGYGQWLRNTQKMNEGLANGDHHAGWLGGNGANYLDDYEAGTQAVWYAKALVEMDIPWGNTEAQKILESLETAE